ncbi:hypothetical protein CHS0354_003335 [Potamilus streckersoni]|uniref:Cyanophycinase n=1 Tax=Potamilus streckersoni TaxID=2493646 RepID=A0AAE0S4Y5_9BIVA|nr:hypothetical protein CHS0354_003335 [Potamilus streckersoni]
MPGLHLILLILEFSNSLCFVFDDALPQYATYGESMVLVGGNLADNNTEIYDTIVQMAGGRGVAKIGLIHASSADPLDSANFYHDIFVNKYGAAEANFIPIDTNHTSANRDPNVIRLIRRQTGFFFGGGDQYRVTQSLLLADGSASPALVAIMEMKKKGAVISGSSAGTTCQTNRVMIRGGVSWDALKYGAYETESSTHPDNLVYQGIGGIGLFHNYVIDTHFSQRGREGRIIRLLWDTRKHSLGSNYAFGVDENTALVVTHDGTSQGTGKVIGAAGVTLFDISSSIQTSARYFSIRDVYLSYLTYGDQINLQTRAITFSPTKTRMAGHEMYSKALTSHDIFYGGGLNSGKKPEFVRVATSVYDSIHERVTYGTTHESNPTFKVTMSAVGHDSEGWVERKHSFHSDIISYKNLYVSISEQ